MADLTPYPTVIYWSDLYSWNSPLGFSNYQALQIQLNKRLSRGLQFLSNYTFSKNIGNISSAFGDTWGMNYWRPMDYYNLSLEKSVLEFDQTHVVKIGASYDLPFGRGRSFGGDMPRAVDFVAWRLDTPVHRQLCQRHSGGLRRYRARLTAISQRTARSSTIRAADRWSIRISTASTFDMTDISNPRPDKKYIDTSKIIDPVTIDRYARGNAPRLMSQLAQLSRRTRKTYLFRRTSLPAKACASSSGPKV